MRHKSLDSILLLFCIECVTFPAGSHGPKRQQCKKLTNKPGQVHKYFFYIVCLVIERESEMEGSEKYRDRQGDTGGDSLLNTVNPIIVTLFCL